MKAQRSSGFTLVELLVVMVIISILVALSLPAVQAARESARASKCQNNLKQIGLALLNYERAHEVFPPGGLTEGYPWSTYSRTNWAISILPHLDQQGLYSQYDMNKVNEHPDNRYVRETSLPVYICPSDIHGRGLGLPETGMGGKSPGGHTLDSIRWARGSYRGMAGFTDGSYFWDFPPARRLPEETRGLLHHWSGNATDGYQNFPFGPVQAASVRDGLSNTLAVGEAAFTSDGESEARETYWAYTYACYNLGSASLQSRTLIADYDRCVAIGGPGKQHTCKRGWGSFHTSGAIHFVRADGSLTAITPSVNMEVFKALATIAGNESSPNLDGW